MKTILIITISFLIGTISSFGQLADHVVIAEIYGGGGNSSSYWTHDYIILYNPTSNSVDVSTWSVQIRIVHRKHLAGYTTFWISSGI